jgi:hypothetical protein
LVGEDSVFAEGPLAWRFREVQTVVRFIPLPVSVQKGEDGDGSFEESSGEFCDAVESRFFRGVQNQIALQGN